MNIKNLFQTENYKKLKSNS